MCYKKKKKVQNDDVRKYVCVFGEYFNIFSSTVDVKVSLSHKIESESQTENNEVKLFKRCRDIDDEKHAFCRGGIEKIGQ